MIKITKRGEKIVLNIVYEKNERKIREEWNIMAIGFGLNIYKMR